MRGAAADIYVGRRLQGRCSRRPSAQSKEFKDEYVSSEHLLLALVDQGPRRRHAALLKDAGVRKDALLKALAEVRGTQRVTDPGGRGQVPGAGQVHPRPHRAGAQAASWTR